MDGGSKDVSGTAAKDTISIGSGDRVSGAGRMGMEVHPMMDNLDTKSSKDNHGKIWNTRRNHFGWKMYLRRDAKNIVSPYAAPARQTDYTGLPLCYTFVGDGEPFYSETLTYVENLRAAGVEAECDVYPSDTHAFDMLYPERRESQLAAQRFTEQFARRFAAPKG